MPLDEGVSEVTRVLPTAIAAALSRALQACWIATLWPRSERSFPVANPCRTYLEPLPFGSPLRK